MLKEEAKYTQAEADAAAGQGQYVRATPVDVPDVAVGVDAEALASGAGGVEDMVDEE